MTTTTALIKSTLRPGVNEFFGDYPELPAEWSQIFTKYTSNMAYEKDVEIRLMGLAQVRAEGAATEFQDIGEGPAFIYRHMVYATGFVTTDQAIRDNLYKAQFPSALKSLKSSMAHTKEVVCIGVLNNATTTVMGDGVPLLSTAHPIINGTVANTPAVPQQLSEPALQDSITRIYRFKDAAGMTKRFKARKLIVSPEMMFVAQRLFGTNGRVGTADNDISVVTNMFPEGWMCSSFLNNKNAWFVLTDVNDGLKYFQRDPLETKVWTDEVTDNVMTTARERYSAGASDFRAIDGSMP